MSSLRKYANLSGWLVFAIAFTVYFFTVERTGSLWDCGEFILGAYKLQVVHPPGAPLFLIISRMFAAFGDMISSDPSVISWMVNLSSGLLTAFSAMFVAWVTVIFGNIILNGRSNSVKNQGEGIALAGAGLAGGLATAFSISIWFSAVEGEVYAMSLFFTTLTLWSAVKWYNLPNDKENDRWLVFTIFSTALSIGVHLLSLLVLPALGILYYMKKYETHKPIGFIAAAGIGALMIGVIQTLVITGIPQMWAFFDVMLVNQFGLPFHSGLIPTFIIIAAILYFGLKYAHQKKNHIMQVAFVSLTLISIAYMTYGVTVIRANAEPPVNMNAPTDALRLLPYLKREQYGDRPLVKGIDFDKGAVGTETTERLGQVGDRYEHTDYAYNQIYNERDKRFFPRMPHNSGRYPQMYRNWLNLGQNESPTTAHNIRFFLDYQINWMYFRYFMWNFAGRTNANQGVYSSDLSRGQWMSGIPFVDKGRLYDMTHEPDAMKHNEGRNKYYLLPFIFGVIGMVFHFRSKPKEAFALFTFFFISGLGLIIYSNQPPGEPRERDYVFAGSFFAFSIWIGLAVIALYKMFLEKMQSLPSATLASALVLTAPTIMAFQNFDDMGRRHHTGARDMAHNFLESLEPNSIIFTYGDNDTYPLWYAQEVENIRTDVRVVNLSLIAVDWYIDLLRRKVNDSEKLKFSIPKEALRGHLRNQLFIHSPSGNTSNPMPLTAALKWVAEDHPIPLQNGRSLASYLPSQNLFMPIDSVKARESGLIYDDSIAVSPAIPIRLTGDFVMKDDIAILDIINSNIYDRPIYFATTTVSDKLYNLQEYLKLEGLALRLTAQRAPVIQQLGNFGVGGVDLDKNDELFGETFKYGGFDTRKMFVDESYNPAVTSTKMSMLRSVLTAVSKERWDVVESITDSYFRAFPDMNFPYDGTAMNMINSYIDAKKYDKAKVHLRILAEQIRQQLEFFESLPPHKLVGRGFDRTQREYSNLLPAVVAIAGEVEDEAFEKEIEDKLAHLTSTANNQ